MELPAPSDCVRRDGVKALLPGPARSESYVYINMLFRSKPGWPRFSIVDIMVAIAAIALALVWPPASLFVCGGILFFALLRAGFTQLDAAIIVCALAFALGFAVPPIVPR